MNPSNKSRSVPASEKPNAEYDPKYDAYYDKTTGEWLEQTCGDEDCDYCKSRPKKHHTPVANDDNPKE
jgi:hypothetical protein